MIKSLGFDKQKIANIIMEKDLNGIFLSTPENVYYFTGAPVLPGTGNPILFALRNNVPSFAFVDEDGNVTLFLWFGVTLGIDFQSNDIKSYMDLSGAIEEIENFFKSKNLKIGIEKSCPVIIADIFKNNNIQFDFVDELITNLRLIKSQDEISYLKKALEIAELAIVDVSKNIKPGITRKDLANFIRSSLMKHDATGIDHLTIAFGPSNPEVLIDENLNVDQVITVDIGAVYEGYVSDIRKLFYYGKKIPDSTVIIFNKILHIMDKISAFIKPGIKFSEIYDYAVNLYNENDLEPMFLNVGHSIGLLTEELLINSVNNIQIQENMVINIELYSPDENGTMIGDEETYLIKNGKCGILNRIERKITVIE